MRISPLAIVLFWCASTLQGFQEPYAIGNGVSAPVRVSKLKEPKYTKEARKARIQGEVQVSAIISNQGIPTEVTVMRSLDPGLDRNTVETVRGWRFKPGMKDGVPVAVRVKISVEFRLTD